MVNFTTVSRKEAVGIGGTDAKRILEGDWLPLYMEKIGEVEPVDLSNEWKPRLGLETEALHAWWHAKQEKVECQLIPGAVVSQDIPWLFASLDRYLPLYDEPLEMKHTFAANNMRDCATTYMPQLQTQLLVTGCSRLRFSIIRGNEPPIWAYVDRDQNYIDAMLPMLKQFWWHVENRIAPEIAEVTDTTQLARSVPLNGFKVYDMTGNNEWAMSCATYIVEADAADRYEKAKAQLKKSVPADASEASGYGVTIKRDARGALRFS
jgi:predicted phage-related endonuclease